MTAEFITKHEAAKILGVSPDTLKVYRRKGLLQEGDYICRNPRVIRYNKALIEDWAVNGNSLVHLQAIEAYQASLISNKKKVRQPSKGVG